MKTPRLALLVLCAALAPALAHSGETWKSLIVDGDQWMGILFTDENGTERSYWARTAEAKAPNAGEAKLYSLMKKESESVKGVNYYESVASVYTLRFSYRAPQGRGGSPTWIYTATRAGTSLTLPATAGVSLAASIWGAAHPETRPAGRGSSAMVPANPYTPGTTKVNVVIAAPGDKVETLTPTPMTHFQVGVGPANWNEYYFDRAARPRPSGRGAPADTDASYRTAMPRFTGMHRRIHPFEVVLGPSLCYVIPENCGIKDKPEHAEFIEAGDQAEGGNMFPTKDLAVRAHAHFKGVAEGLRAQLKSAPENEFGREETVYIQRLLANAGKSVEFQSEMNASRGDPAKLKLFVKKWRAYLTEENEAYLREVAGVAGLDSKEVGHAALLAAMAKRMEAALKAPLQPPLPPARPGGGTDAAPVSVIDQDSPFAEWSSFEAKLESGADYPFVSVHCHTGVFGGSPAKFVRDAGARQYECVSLRAPAPGAARDFASPSTADIGLASFVQPPPANINDVKMLFIVKEGKTAAGTRVILSNGRAMQVPAGARSFHPTRKEPAPAPLEGLTAKELVWLTRVQAAAYARTAKTREAAAPFRVNIADNLKPAAASGAYSGLADKAATTAAQLEAVLPAAVWGGDNKEVVGEFGTKTDVQLSEEEFKILSGDAKYKEALDTYRQKRETNNGNVSPVAGKPEFNAEKYDPIALHLIVMAARKALPAAAPPGGGGAVGPGYDPVNLTVDEKKLLTQTELQGYEIQEKEAAKPNARTETKDALRKLNSELRAKIAAGTPNARKPYPAEASTAGFKLADFDKMQDWQKRKFCDEHPTPAGAVAGDRRGADLDTGADAQRGVKNSAAAGDGAAGTADTAATAWIGDACKPYRAAPPPTKPGGGGGNNLTVKEPPKPGDDKEFVEEKKKDPFAKDLLIAGLKGGLLGLLIGSLFGPIGLILGPMIGAAIYYGMASAEKNKPSE